MYRDLYSLTTKLIWFTIKDSLTLTDQALSSIVASSAFVEKIQLLPDPLSLLPWPLCSPAHRARNAVAR